LFPIDFAHAPPIFAKKELFFNVLRQSRLQINDHSNFHKTLHGH